MEEAVFYRCEVCGNIVALLKNGGGTLTCCGETMTVLKANSTDGAKEKHVPVAANGGGKVKVTVGSAIHPMIPEHYIEWIAFARAGKLEIVYLRPGMEPKAEFEGETAGTAYAYCNLHGLWKTEVE